MGSAQDASRDQILDEILVGPVPVGVNKFVLEADAPDPSKLAPEDLLGVTVVLVTCSYKEREFVRVGYYVNNEYYNPDAPPPPPPPQPNADGTIPEPLPTPPLPNPVPLEHIQRQILADKPRVTKFPISWGDDQTTSNGQNGMLHSPAGGSSAAMGQGFASSTATSGSAGILATTVASSTVAVTPPGTGYSASSLHDDTSSGVVYMQEESNTSHPHFSGNGGREGVQAMNE